MAAKIDQEFLKKHHFWVLHAVLAIGLALAWFGLLVSVPSSIAEQGEKNKKEKTAIDSAKAQPRATLELYNSRKQELFQLRGKRWRDMWEIQKNMYDWPEVLGEEQLAKTAKLKFGDDISNASLLEAFKTQYAKEYDLLAKKVAPMQFNGGWKAVLRHVGQWRLTPESEEVWLALEDLWVQREFVNTIAKINEDASKFYPLNPSEDPTKSKVRSFRNRTWGVEIEIVEEKGAYSLRGKIRNLTDRLQAFGVNNELVLNVWLSDDANAKPFEFAIEGTSLEGGKEEKIKYLEKRHKVFEGRVAGVYRVEQVYDARTLPVKRIDKIALGYTSARHSLAELEMTPFSTKVATAETEAAAAGGGSGGGKGGDMFGGGMPMGGGAEKGGGAATDASGAKTTTPNLLIRSRYVHRTDQVRSMPIAASVICDQTYSADVLTALANSRLRMQIVQSHLSRFRGTITYVADSSSSGASSPAGFPPPGGRPGGNDSEGSGVPSPGFPPPGGGMKGGMPNYPGPMGGFPGTMGGFPGMQSPGSGNAPRSSSEDMVAGNLIELSVYGIASLYEKYQPDVDPNAPKESTEAAAPKSEETPKGPVEGKQPGEAKEPVAPAEGTPAPKTGEAPQPKDGTAAPKEAGPNPKEAGPAPKEATPPPKS